MLQEKLDKLRIEEFQNKELYDNINRASQSLFEIPRIYELLLYIANDFIKAISYMFMIIFWQWWIFVVVVAINLFALIRKYKVLEKRFVKYWYQSPNERKANYYSHIMRKKESLTELKSLNAFGYILEKYKKIRFNIFNEENEINRNEVKTSASLSIIDEILSTGFFIYLLIETASKRILIGNFYAYRTAMSSISNSMRNTTDYLALLNIRLLNAKEVIDFLEYKIDYVDGTKILKQIDTIEFKNVWFKYQNRKEYALRGINLLIENGEKIAFIGENGCGKTTMMKLLMKIHFPTKGRIFINGINIKGYSTKSVRDRMTILFQDIIQYEDTVRENITLDKKKRGVDKVLESIPSENFKKELKKLPKGIDTILGTWFGDGNDISKGQQQRLALARIFNRGDQVLLLDEPNSALDPRAEKELFQYIVNKQKDKTCILTLHVFTNINQLDRVVMFEKGKIVADGKHNDLYKKSKQYKEYYDLQEQPN
jgi:ATP-binding cassette subfamily C protein